MIGIIIGLILGLIGLLTNLLFVVIRLLFSPIGLLVVIAVIVFILVSGGGAGIDGIIDSVRDVFSSGDAESSSATLKIGGRAIVRTAEDGKPCRADADTDSEITARLADGTEVTLVDGPVSQDGFEWWLVESPAGLRCWIGG